MKSTVVCFVIASLLLVSNAYAQGTCAVNGANPGGVGPVTPYESGAINSVDPFNYPPAIQPAAYVGVRPLASQARITVVDAASPLRTQVNTVKSSAPTARLTVVADDSTREKPVAKVADAPQPVEQTKLDVVTETTPSTESDDATISDALKGLVGTWKAVARHGDGELTTVELRLDDRGWAELTVPRADGKPSTIKRRAELNGQELKLTGPNAELLLGELIDVNSRQMVLARAGGQVTFVRP